MLLLTFQLHSAAETLVEPACGTLLPSSDRDGTVPSSQTHIVLAILYGALEEALARLARENAVVEATDLVAADWTGAKIVTYK